MALGKNYSSKDWLLVPFTVVFATPDLDLELQGHQ